MVMAQPMGGGSGGVGDSDGGGGGGDGGGQLMTRVCATAAVQLAPQCNFAP